jgi:hypothetical protein
MTILHRNPDKIVAMSSIRSIYNSEVFCNQIEEETKLGIIKPTDPEQLFISMISLIIFPFAIKELIADRNNFSKGQFKEFVLARKELVASMLLQCIKK